ncbi:MAG: sensor domain-containing protein, partial [Acidimicrobiales bacterium]
MMLAHTDTSGFRLQLRLGGKERAVVVSQARVDQIRGIARVIWSAPFSGQTWRELFFFASSMLLSAVGILFLALTMSVGTILLVTFVGIVLIAWAVRGARKIGSGHRSLARNLLDEHIEEPEPFHGQPGFFGWLQSVLRDRTGWRAIAYSFVKVALGLFGIWFALSVWVDAFF